MIVREPRGHGRNVVRLAPLIAALTLAACGGGGGGMPQMPPTGVNVATVVSQRVAQWDEYTGRIEAVDSVEIRPRVAGYIAGVHFTDGAIVARGDLLFTIDDREYRAAADSAAAGVARAATRVDVARTELARTEKLAEVRAASTEELEQRRGELRQAEADLKATEAQARQAALNLGFTRITSPIDGRASLARLRVGNLVGAGDPVLTTVVSLDPVYVTFRGDERAYLRYQGMAREGTRPSSRDAANPVRVALADDTGFPHEGHVVFVDNAVDPATGTILARAELPNPEGRFTPGLFARVQLLGSGERDALLVHPQAVLTDQDRRYVYVAAPVTSPQGGPQYTGAVRKDVVLGPVVNGLVVVEQGLAPTDQVVVNGMRKIFFPGAPVAPVEVPMDAPNTIAAAPGAAPAPAAATEGGKG
jgi:multidrug efflux system membrane fusion protein